MYGVASSFREKTGKKNLYNITAIKNIPSIIQNGILCYDSVREMDHYSIAMDDVQRRRDQVIIPGGLRLHQYANLYFTYNNPMLYKRKGIAETICILAVSSDVLDIEDCVVSDRNAATQLVKFYSPGEGIDRLDFDKIYAQYWNHDNQFEYNNHKAIKCAEILIPGSIPYNYIIGAYTVSNTAKQEMINYGFDREIIINPRIFYS